MQTAVNLLSFQDWSVDLAGEPCEFTIVTKDAGPGGLALAVHGPSKAEITCTDNGDGTCTVQYVPDEPGKLSFSFGSEEISRL